MFTENDIRELAAFTSEKPVLSLYLNTEPSRGNSDEHKLRLRNMLKQVNLPQDVEAVERFFNHQYDWSGRGIIVFSCAHHDFFRSFPVAVPIHDLVQIADRPSLKPMATLLDNYGGYGVVLVDKQGARLFFFHLGELREQNDVLGQTVKRVKRGGASSLPGRRGGTTGPTRALEETIGRNMKDTAEATVRFFEENHVRRVLMGGTDDNVAQLRGLLPKGWQSLVVGTFPVSMTANQTEVMARAMEIGLQAELRRDAHIVETLITNAAKNSNAVVGLENTLSAFNDGRLHILVVTEGYHIPGFQCLDCGYLTTVKGNCQNCGGENQPVEDIIERALSTVMHHGGEFEIIKDSPALDKAGHIGALLRY